MALFRALWDDRDNWGGSPGFGCNVGTPDQRGNLTDLKKHGLVRTQVGDGISWVHFTPKGEQLGAQLDAARQNKIYATP